MNNVITALKLFDTLILPIIRYGSEAWSPFYAKNINDNNFLSLCEKFPAEKLHTKFCRYLLGVSRKTTNIAVRAELGRLPLLTSLLPYAAKYWLQLCDLNGNRLVNDAHLDLITHVSHAYFNWAKAIQLIWTTFSLQVIWDNQGSLQKHRTIQLLKQAVYASYELAWSKKINEADSKLRTYKLFQNTIGLGNYTLINNIAQRREFAKLRISAHQLRIELGRYSVPKKTPLEERICQYCNSNQIEDEKHFVMNCPLYASDRQSLFSSLGKFTSFNLLDEDEQFIFLLSYNEGDMEILLQILQFINLCTETRKQAQIIA